MLGCFNKRFRFFSDLPVVLLYNIRGFNPFKPSCDAKVGLDSTFIDIDDEFMKALFDRALCLALGRQNSLMR
jgi:hypothetical protein